MLYHDVLTLPCSLSRGEIFMKIFSCDQFEYSDIIAILLMIAISPRNKHAQAMRGFFSYFWSGLI